MNNGNVRKIIILAALLATGGCSSVPMQNGYQATGRPILSAEDAQSMIHVTVTSVPADKDSEALVAANDY